VLAFLRGGAIVVFAQLHVAGRQRLGGIQGLRAHLTDMIDAHQCGRFAALGFGQVGVVGAFPLRESA
jgi:hypothetical protein